MTDMFGETDKVAEGLTGLQDSFGGGSVMLAVNFLIEGEDRNHADIRELLRMQAEIGRVVIKESDSKDERCRRVLLLPFCLRKRINRG
jgi:hypothetical protein